MYAPKVNAQLGVKDVLEKAQWPEAWPYSAADFSREDESKDSNFYSFPRLCFHIDDKAVAALTKYYDEALRRWDKPNILDLCASHVSHFPADIADFAGNRVALGMNEEELKQNGQVNDYVVRDLNDNPKLPFPDNSFDVVTNCVSIDYLSNPLGICKEVARVLKPGGAAIFALSNRCFPSKAVQIWLRTNDLEHVFIVGSYFHYSGLFEAPTAQEITPSGGKWFAGSSSSVDYLSVVRATVKK